MERRQTDFEVARMRRARRFGAPAVLLGALLAMTAPASGSDDLYSRLGGEPVVTAIATELIQTAATDAATKRSFDGVDLDKVAKQLALQLCELTGGGCKRDGDSMKDVHGGLGITQQEYYALVEQLRRIMDKHGLRIRERNELLAILAPMKRDVVEK